MGVTKQANGKFRARYSLNGERNNVGVFDTELKAKRALNKHRKEHDFSDIWKEKNNSNGNLLDDYPLKFEEPKPTKPFKLNPSRPTILSRVKPYIAKGKLWLKEQLDR